MAIQPPNYLVTILSPIKTESPMNRLLPITTIKANGVEIAYELHGAEDAPVIMLIHGLGMPMTAWPMEMVEQLVQAGFRVLRIDNRDQGQSQKFRHLPMPNLVWQMIRMKLGLRVNAPYPLTDLMKDTLGVLDGLGIDQVHVVGVSMGGMIAQLLAIHHPERVLSLTSIMSTTGNPKLPQADRKVLAHLMSAPKSQSEEDLINYHVKTWQLIGSPKYPTSKQDLREFVKGLLDRGISPSGTTRQMLAILATRNRYQDLNELKMPVQVIHGTADPLIPVAAGKETAQAAHAKLHLVEGMGHDLPEALHSQICSWIIEQAKAAPLKSEISAAV